MEFLEEITSRLSGTVGVFLALIGPEWLPAMAEISPADCMTA